MIQDIHSSTVGRADILPAAAGYVLHEGTINGHAYVAVATLKTDNPKTGDMVQIWFILRDVHPVEAVSSGLDFRTICKDCPFSSGRGCYVQVANAPAAIWKAFHRGNYPKLEPRDYPAIFTTRKVRFGAYGNPTLLPIAMVRAIAELSDGWTGYFHDWKTNRYASLYANYFMASTETEDSRRMASKAGFRYFHASPKRPAGAIECLSDAKGLQCAQCKLCAGLSKDRMPSVWINPHGSKANKAKQAAGYTS